MSSEDQILKGTKLITNIKKQILKIQNRGQTPKNIILKIQNNINHKNYKKYIWEICFKIWRRKWQPTPVFLPGVFRGQRSLVGYSLQGHKELDTTEQFSLTSHTGMNIIVQMNIIVRVLLRVILPIFLGNVPRGGIDCQGWSKSICLIMIDVWWLIDV